MLTENELQSVTTWLSQCQHPLLVSHRRPDGDALGALAAMSLILRGRGQEPVAGLFDAFPPRYEFLKPAVTWHVWNETPGGPVGKCDAVVILDTCAATQLEPIVTFLDRAPRTLVIDHHTTRDALGVRPGDLRVFDETASATCLIVAEWARSCGTPANGSLATALFTGIATDCGWFRYTNTDARTLRVAAGLVEAGADVGVIYNVLYRQDPPAKLRLIGRMLSSLELKAGGKLAVVYLRANDFAATGAGQSMTEDLINEVTRLAGTEVTLLFTEEEGEVVRVNFRSRQEFDVAQFAQRYGGGGHARAAGARLRGAWDLVVPRVIADVIGAL